MTPERRAELRALLAKAPEFIREDPLVRDMPALLDALDASDARERRLREALEQSKWSVNGYSIGTLDDAANLVAEWFNRQARIDRTARAALSEVAPDA